MSGVVRGVRAVFWGRRVALFLGLLALLALALVAKPTFGLGVLIFIAALLISIMLHELGHFATAKLFGMKVTQFFLGFGNTVWSRSRGETEYGVKALPLGGFVKITGMTSLDEVDPADEPRSFRRKPGWQRMIVMAAGSAMHFLLALFLLFVLAAGIGLANSSTTTIAVISCVPKSETITCARSGPASPAARAGLLTGDKIVAIGGRPVHTWAQLGAAIRAQRAGTPVAISFVRDGRRLTRLTDLATVSWHKGSFLGISQTLVFQRASPVAAVADAGRDFGQIMSESLKAAARLPEAVPHLFAKNRAETTSGQVSVVGAANVTGQVVEDNIGWRQKIATIILIVASLNVFVGVFNLLPLLPLDGGHLAVIIFERVRAWLARLRRRPDPGQVNIQRLIPVSIGVFGLLVGLGVLLIAADIVNPVGLQ